MNFLMEAALNWSPIMAQNMECPIILRIAWKKYALNLATHPTRQVAVDIMLKV